MTTFKVGTTYRNRYMLDVDFWCSAVDGHSYKGWWVLRRNGRILNKEVDTIKGIRYADWKEVDDSESSIDK